MTKQEQIDEMAKIVDEMYNVYTTTADDIAEGLYNAGYRKVDDFDECRKCPAWSGTDCTRNPYTEGCLDDKVNLKNEIKRLEKENKQLKTECALLDDELRIARQDTINVLNELKTKAFDKDAFNGWSGSTFVVLVRDIDEMIEELTKCRR
nr:MAG TPA: Cby-like protein [Caudoviricetes sp.]